MPTFLERIKARRFGSASSGAVSIGVNGESDARLDIDAGGKLVWGSGSATGDTNLYRSAADRLQTDDVFVGSSGLVTTTTSGAPTASLPDGAIAIDTTNNILYIRSGSAWVESSGGASVTVSDAAPSTPDEGDLWFESDTGDIFVYYSGVWVDVGGTSVANIAVTASPPTSGSVNGDIWFDTDTARTYVYYDDGTSTQWVEIGSSSAAANGVDGAIQFASGGTFSSDDANLHWDDTNNRLGIGTTSPASSLEVHTDFPKLTLTNDDQLVSADAYFAGIEMRDSSENFAGAIGFISGEDQDMRITSYRTGADLHLVTGGANNERVTITDTGNVGIGTTSPQTELHLKVGSGSGITASPFDVNHHFVIDSDSGGGMGIYTGNTSSGYLRFGDSDSAYSGGFQYDHSQDLLYVRTGGSNRVYVNSSGNVGINDATPSYTLDVSGDINATGNIRSNGVSITSNHGWHTRMLSADALTLTTSLQWVPFGYDDIDTDSYHDTTTNKTRITIPSNLGGWYAISMRVAITYTNPPSLLTCFCRPNGNGNSTTGTLIGTIVPQATFGGGGSVSGTIYLAGGSYIEMGVYATGGSNVSLLGTSTGQYTTVFHGARVSP